MKTLAIETSCDDTSLWVVNYTWTTFEVEKILAYSQIKDHEPYGGVVPELASRLHANKIIQVFQKLELWNLEDIDFISVTTHPGLPGSLVIGKTAAGLLGEYFQKPVMPVNHIHAHIVSIFLEREYKDIKLPAVILTASWGHNDLYLLDTKAHPDLWTQAHLGQYHIYKLWSSRDDASGEAFDKVSKMLGGPYPWGPWISKQAASGKQVGEGKLFRRIRLEEWSLDFSFSGIKSQVNNYLTKMKNNNQTPSEQEVCDIAYEFQESIVEVLSTKLIQAGQKYSAKTLGICGGVSANRRLRERIQSDIQDLNLTIPAMKPTKIVYSTDNAAMIWVAGIIKKLAEDKASPELNV